MFARIQQFFASWNASSPDAVTPHYIPSFEPGLFTICINGAPVATYSNKDYDFSYFSAGCDPLHLEISGLSPIDEALVSPLKLNIIPTIADGKVSATLPGPGYYIIKIGASRQLVILADSHHQSPASGGTGIWNVQDHGAASNGTSISDTTAAFQSCLDAASDSSDPNALVFVPPGLYAVGNIVLKSNSSFYLSPGAILRFSPEEKDQYKIHWYKNSQGRRPITWWISTAFGSRNIRVFGHGVLDGNGVAAAAAGIGNNLLVPIQTENFSCEGILFLNSASWACTPIMVTNGTFQDCKFINRFTETGENDGIDVMHSENIVVRHAIGIGLDDPFSTKTWGRESDIAESWPLPDDGLPGLRGVTFDDTLSWTICFGVKVGAGMWSPHEDIVFRNAVVYDTSIAIGIHFQSGSSRVKGVLFEDIDVENATWTNMDISTWCAFMVTGGDAGEEDYPIQDVVVKNVRVRMGGRKHAVLAGQQGRVIDQVEFRNVVMPGSIGQADSLEDMQFEDVMYAQNITIS
ncbi:pectin lyase fold/virulence factor [Tricharina praecox]|uniref:pectin lyase fold/virulence factor n=1 Tax=Tricharina praecox TaxID=43433 RepID=UPI00221EDEC8|nr:pectin lyase fold/virulence factor [Tricharina praecox]KAI5856044.1 pectin lyase fold/virulence factor [Tricharina praecox]